MTALPGRPSPAICDLNPVCPHVLDNAITHVAQRLDYQLGLTEEAARDA